jgi:hypothetical protein
MKTGNFFAVGVCVAVLSAGAFAGQGTQAKSDSATQQVSAPAQKPALSKQTSVKPVAKKTNWSKIKTMFE